MGERILITTFVVIVIGGVGSVRGRWPARCWWAWWTAWGAPSCRSCWARCSRRPPPIRWRAWPRPAFTTDGDRADRQAGRAVPGARMSMGMTLSNRGRWGLAGWPCWSAAGRGGGLGLAVPDRRGDALPDLRPGRRQPGPGDRLRRHGELRSRHVLRTGRLRRGHHRLPHLRGRPIFGWAGSNAALVVWPIALAVCALAGWVFGYLLRTRGVQFIMITLAFGQMVYFILVSLQFWRRRRADDLGAKHAAGHQPGKPAGFLLRMPGC